MFLINELVNKFYLFLINLSIIKTLLNSFDFFFFNNFYSKNLKEYLYFFDILKDEIFFL